MAFKSLTEVLDTVPVAQELKARLKNEMRDFLAHEVARFCQGNGKMDSYDAITDFVLNLVKDVPVTGVKPLRLFDKESGLEVRIGDVVTSFRGQHYVVEGFEAPKNSFFEGKIYVKALSGALRARFFVGSFNCEYRE